MTAKQYRHYFPRFYELERKACEEYELVKIPDQMVLDMLARRRNIARARAEDIMKAGITANDKASRRMECLLKMWENGEASEVEKQLVVVMGFCAYAIMVMEEYAFMTFVPEALRYA